MIFWLLPGVLAVPCVVFATEVGLSSVRRGAKEKRTPSPNDPRPNGEPNGRRSRATVLVPAHNEELGIAETVSVIRKQLGPDDEVLVVADNCNDATADKARAAGARVIERTDTTKRGKGYALSFGLEALQAAPPDVIVIVDADCELADGCIERLVALCGATSRPVQADYVMRVPRTAAVGARISAFAFRVRNRVRPAGLAAIGMPCHLAGTGMAFPWQLLRDAPPLNGHITEDLMLGLELALVGKAPVYCGDANVLSDLAQSTGGQDSQRERWEHGHLGLIKSHLPRLLGQALARRDPRLLATALDLCVPPLALLSMGVAGAVGTSAVAVLVGAGVGPLLLAGAEASALTGALTLCWKLAGKDLLTAQDLAQGPSYFLRKVPSYMRALSGKAERAWKRAERESK